MRARWAALAPVAWAILACGNGMPIDLGQEFRAPMEDPPEAAIPDFPPELGLDARLVTALGDHLQLLVHAPSGEAPFCEALSSASALVGPLEAHLNTALQSAEPEAFGAAVARLDQLVPGVGLQLGSEGVAVWHAPDQLTRFTDGNSGALIGAAAEVLPHPFPGWMQQTTDLGGCNDPGRAADALQRVADRWSLATSCVRSALKDPMRDTLKQMVAQRCYCEGRNDVMRSAASLERPLGLLDDLGGNQLLSGLRKAISHPESQFQATCGG